MSQPISTSAKSQALEVLHSIPCGSEQYELGDPLHQVSVYTLFAFDNRNEIIERESFYLSVYACPENRDTEALACQRAWERAGYHVVKHDSVGEVDRI